MDITRNTGSIYTLLFCCQDRETTLYMYGHAYSKSMNQPGKVANPGRGHLNKETENVAVRGRA